MSGQGVLDPRLGSASTNQPPPQYGSLPHSQPYISAPHQQSPQPYYHYQPSSSHTPQQHSASAPSTGTQSNQASPKNGAAYCMPEQAASPEEEHAEGEHGPEDAKRPRACEACRGLKVRCDQDPAQPNIPCKRCAKANRPCIVTQPSRKRQKKADTRVAELEKKLDALTAVLHQHHGATSSFAAPHAPGTHGMSSAGAPVSHPNAYDGQPASVMSHPAPSIDSSMHPPQKRRRTSESAAETETLDGADVTINEPVGKYSSSNSRSEKEIEDDIRSLHDHWGPRGGGLKGYLHPSTSPEDFVKRINQLISADMANTIFNRYITKIMPHLPAVVLPPGTTAEQVWRDKPILYVCILSASSSGTLHPDISKQLAKEAVGAIADCVVRNGAKSLELIQAMQVMALWYKPPERAEQTNFYQIIHMASVMALDIGLGKRFNPVKARRGFGGPHANFAPGPTLALPQDSDTLEARRAWLCCYYLCASASMVLRRPNLIRWTNYMKECIEVLETHPDAYPSDKLFCQHVKIQHICEDIGLQFLMDDNTATVSITDPKVSYQLNVLENDLKKWKENIPPECRCPQLQFFEHVTSLYLHEIALHFNHNVEDFRLPFTEESLKSVNSTSDTLTQNQMAALEACYRAAHGILETMLSFGIQTVKCLPMLIFFVRSTYAIVILIKMHVAISTPGSELGKIMKAEDLRVDYFLDSLISMFGYVAKEEEFRPHPKILRILCVLKDWFNKHVENVAAQARGERPPHTSTRNPSVEPTPSEWHQTPLDLLSQVATRKHQPTDDSSQARPDGQSDWTFNSPYVFDPSQRPPQGHPDNQFPIYRQQAQQGYSQYSQDVAGAEQNMPLAVDPTNPDGYVWGSGFEQAMDMAMGGMDGLSGGGLDGWFLGDSLAPFGFNGDSSVQGW